MKKALLLTFLTAMTVGLFAQQVPKMALLEHFTSASCPPCNPANVMIQEYFNTTSSNVVAIRYQGNFNFDPMETPESVTRNNYYNVSSYPNSVIDGTFNDHPNTYFQTGGTSATMDAQAALMSDFSIGVIHTLKNDLSGVDIDVVITSGVPVGNNNLVAHVVVVEKLIAFPSAPGTNGETEFHNVMRKMLPNTNGTALQGVWTANQTQVIQQSWDFVDVYNIGELAVVAFIQDTNTGEVLQAGYSENLVLPGNLSTADLSATASHSTSGYCDNNYSPVVTVSNASSNALDSVEVSYTKNGVPSGSQMIAIAANGSQTVTFPDINVIYGDEIVFSSSIGDYGYLDLSTTNNNVSIDNFIVLDPSFDNGTELDVTMDNSANFAPSTPGSIDDNPDDIDAFVISSSAVNGLNWNLGGHGNSDGCFMWDFVAIQQGSSSLIFEEIDLTGTYNNLLSFTYAYAQFFSTDQDALVISASNDCGNTWTEVFNKAGEDLATRDTVGFNPATGNPMRFFPADANVTDEWADVTVPISMFDGQSDIIIKIEGVSGWGNNLYLDDIKTSGFLVSTENTELESSLNVYPNPAVNDFNISFEINETENLNITLVNAIGQTIRTIRNESFMAGEHMINVNTADLPTGTYFVNIRNEVGVITKTVTVTK